MIPKLNITLYDELDRAIKGSALGNLTDINRYRQDLENLIPFSRAVLDGSKGRVEVTSVEQLREELWKYYS